MPLDVLLINPPTTREARYGALGAGGSTLPPLGLAILAAVVRQAGYSVAVLDAECAGLDVAGASRRALELAPAVVGLTSVTMTVTAAAEVARTIKQALPDTFVVLGGPHVSALPEATLEAFPWVDAAALREAEETLPELLSALLRSDPPLSDVAGLVLRRRDGLVRTPERPLVADLDSLPYPAWDLLPDLASNYRPPLNGVSRLPASSLITSRGCSGRCTFCDRTVSGHRMRFHSPEYVFGMMRTLHDVYGIREVHFHDDNLLAKPERVLELGRLMLDSGLDMRWSAEGRVDMVDPDVLAGMSRAGCWQIAYGIESGSQEVLDRLCKGTTLEQARRAVEATRGAGIQARGLFMVGVPGETRESLRATERFALSLGLDDMVVQTFSPHPGTRIARDAGMPQESPAEWDRSSRWEVSFVPAGLTSHDLETAQRSMFRRFYARPKVVLRYARHLLSSASLARELSRGLMAWCRFVLTPGR